MRLRRVAISSLALTACSASVAVTGEESTSTGQTTGSAADFSTETGSETPSGSTTSDGSDDSTESSSSTEGGLDGVVALRVEPQFAIIDSAEGDQPRAFAAIAVMDDGAEQDVTMEVNWSLAGPGTVQNGVVTSPSGEEPIFERAVVTARVNELEASAYAAISVRTQQSGAPQLFNLSHTPEPRQLDFRPSFDTIDIFFLVDMVGWLGEDNLLPYYERVTSLIAPQLQAEGFDVQFGSGWFSAFPLEGSGGDDCSPGQLNQPFELWSPMSSDIAALEASLAPAAAGQALGCVYDRGSFGEALYQIATGEGLDGPGETFVAANPGPRGGVNFREDSIALVLSTVFDPAAGGVEGTPPMQGEAATVAHSYDEIVEALQSNTILHLGHTSAGVIGNTGMFYGFSQLARSTGARIPPSAWNHPELGRPDDCAADECCVDDSEGIAPDADGTCPLAWHYRLRADSFQSPDESYVRDIYALTHYLQTDVRAEVVGETMSVSGSVLPDGTTTASFIALNPIDADDPPIDDMPLPTLEDGVFQNVGMNTNLNYVVTIDPADVPSDPEAPLLFKVGVSLETGYRAGSRVQEYWIVSPPTMR